MRSLHLSVTVSGVTNSSGSATISTGPKYANEVWFPASVSISCTGNQPTPTAPNIATCSIYSGNSVSNSSFVDETYQVLGAPSSIISGISVYPGAQIFAVWANCNINQTVTMTITGTRQMP